MSAKAPVQAAGVLFCPACQTLLVISPDGKIPCEYCHATFDMKGGSLIDVRVAACVSAEEEVGDALLALPRPLVISQRQRKPIFVISFICTMHHVWLLCVGRGRES
jgi:hypothetical protein